MLYYVSVIVILIYMLNYMLLKKNFSRLINNIFIPNACFLGSWFLLGGPWGMCGQLYHNCEFIPDGPP